MSKNNVINRITNSLQKINKNSIPANVMEIGKNCIIDTVGVTIAGSVTPSAKKIYFSANETYKDGNCTILGSDKTLNAAGAALTNGAAAHALDFDDNCYAGIVHGSAVVLPTVLALAQENSLNGQKLLISFIAGLEIQFGIAKAFSNGIYDRGWWTTSILGVLGSAASASKLLDLDTQATSNALALAVVGAGATRAVRGTHAKHFYCGLAAERGITAAKLAKNGAIGPLNAFEDVNGLTRVLNDGKFDPTKIDNIGKDFSIIEPGVDIKKYPVCYASHAAIDGVKSILEGNNLDSNMIKKVICTVPPVVGSNLTFSHPKNISEAQFSLEFALATIIKDGSLNLSHLTDKFINSASLKLIQKKIVMNVNSLPVEQSNNKNICPEWADIEIIMNDGIAYKTFVSAPIGSSKRPLPERLLYKKFYDCVTYAETGNNVEKLYENLRNIESAHNLKSIFS
tara:strand:+ start:28 stop:1392 length:1365 start_codon:yes stop_codon:yes gene_type:complete